VEGNRFAAGFVNVVASPHPSGIYPAALRRIANDPIRYYGNSFAALRAPQQNADDPLLHEGILTVWTEVDTTEPSIDKATLEQIALDNDLIEIFRKRGFNNRSFYYILEESKHIIVIELLNDQGKTLSPKQAGNIFSLLFSKLNETGQAFETTVIPEDDALDIVLGLARLDKVRIVIKRPNPGDHLDTDAAEVLREMEEQNINKDERVFTRQSGTEGIHLNDWNHTRAAVAATDGFVESAGRNGEGKPEKRSTKEYPKIVRRTLAIGTGFLLALRDEARRVRGT